MFERYTDSARRAVFFARYEVSEVGAIRIGTEHILLGLMRVNRGILARILEQAGVSADDLRRDIEARTVGRERIAASVEVPFARDAKHTLQFAAEEADRLNHSYIGTEHLFLGLLRAEGSVAASILASRGLRADDVRNAVAAMSREGVRLRDSEPSGDAVLVEELVQEIDAIKELVERLARFTSGANEAEMLVDRIRHSLSELERRLSE